MGKILVIGIDSASFDLIDPWLKSGELPNIAKLLENGAYGKLASVMPPMSPPAWTTFVTGKNPGKHGIFDFTMRKPGSHDIEFINARFRKAETIWKIMSDAGKRVCAIALPVSYPPEKINGAMISGIDTPGASGGVADPTAFHPRELYDEIFRSVGPYLISPNLFALENEQCDAIVNAALQTVERKMETARHLYNKEAWDCFMIVIGETDALSHRLWHFHDIRSSFPGRRVSGYQGEDPLLRIYRAVDHQLGKLCDLASEDTTVMIMSDHGHGGNSTKALFLNTWLAEKGFLTFKAHAADRILGGFFRRAMFNVLGLAKDIGMKVLPPELKKTILRKTKIAGKVEQALRFSHIDWEKTLAYSEEPPYFPNIWINLEGREPQGIVKPGEEAENLRDQIMAKLQIWKDPETGQNVVKAVHKREDLYTGPFVEKSPEIVIDWNLDNGYSYLFKKSGPIGKNLAPIRHTGRREQKKSKSGDHRKHGLMIVSGNRIERNREISGAELVDLAPTILHRAGIPSPSDMDGTILTRLFTDASIESHPVRYGNGRQSQHEDTEAPTEYTETEEAAIRERLRGLGYIE